MSRATPPVALSFGEFLVKILNPENDGVLELVKNVSCNPNTAGLYLLESRAWLLEAGLKASHVPLDNGVLHCFSQLRWMMRRYKPAVFGLQETFLTNSKTKKVKNLFLLIPFY